MVDIASPSSPSSSSSDFPLLAYLASLGDESVHQLYESRPCVIAIFRSLPPVGQQCVLQMMFRKTNDWRSWTRKRHQSTVLNALHLLSRLRILEGDFEDGEFQLNLDFRMNYISSLLASPLELSELRQHPLDEKTRKAADKDLMGKSVERWESILCYLALPNETPDKTVSDTSKALFRFMGLVSGNSKEPEISSMGFQFLLLGRNEQIWAYLIHYMRFMASKGEEICPLLEFLFRLTLCLSADDSPIRPLVLDPSWPEQIQAFVLTLREIGLIFIRKRKDGWFLLTPLMAQLSIAAANDNPIKTEKAGNGQESGVGRRDPNSRLMSGGDRFLIVETNYRVYAYTSSTLQLAILSTFTELLYRFQDLTIGILTRDSIRRALQTGITARQITQYLEANSPPSSSSSEPSIPVTVVEQIYLWEQERKRYTCTEGTLYSNFDSEADYTALRDFGRGEGLALWHCNIGKMVIVNAEGADRVKSWWKAYRDRREQ